jgi:hypothetical protein
MFNVVLRIREEHLKIFRGVGRVIGLLMEVSDPVLITVALQPRPIRQGVS